MSIRDSELIVVKCTLANCKRIENKESGVNVCKGWLDPSYNWSNGDCQYITDRDVPDNLSTPEYLKFLEKVKMRRKLI